VDPKDSARAVAIGRIVFGAAFMLAPGLTGRVWIGEDANRPAVKILTTAIGARDLAAGLGVLMAMSRGKPARGWLEGIALTDALDFTAALLGRERLPTAQRRIVLALAAGSAIQAATAATGVDDDISS
jgi:hypothetical protein